MRVFVWAPVGEFPGRRFGLVVFFFSIQSISDSKDLLSLQFVFPAYSCKDRAFTRKKMHPSKIYTVAGVFYSRVHHHDHTQKEEGSFHVMRRECVPGNGVFQMRE